MTDTAVKTRNTETQPGEITRSFTVTPRVDIVENENEVLVLADMPGVTPENLSIHFEQGQLTVYGRRTTQRPANGYYLREAQPHDYLRSFHISEQVDASKITAELQHGVLTLHLPKSEKAKPRKITVNVKN